MIYSAMDNDPYEQASALLETTRTILDKLEKNWPNSSQSRQAASSPSENETGRPDGRARGNHRHQTASSDRSQQRRAKEKGRDKSRNSDDKNGLAPQNVDKSACKSTRRSKSELLKMIERLESDIQELKLADQPIPNNLANPELTLLDIVSSAGSSPVKMASNTIAPSTNMRNSATYRVSDVGSKVRKTEEIIGKGHKTIRELNDLIMEDLKTTPSKDVAIQVSFLDESEDECAFVEDITTRLVEEPCQETAINPPNRKVHKNVHHLVLSTNDNEPEKPKNSRLTIQRIPDVVIQKSLCRQSLPSIQILPEPSAVLTQSPENVAMCAVNHVSRPPSASSGLFAKDTFLQRSCSSAPSVSHPRKKLLDASLQVDIPSSSSNNSLSDEQQELERRITDFIRMYRRHQTDFTENGDDHREVLDELQTRIKSTKKECEKYKKMDSAAQVTMMNRPAAEAIESSDDIYESDFEAESVPLRKMSVHKTRSEDYLSKENSMPYLGRENSWNSLSNSLSHINDDESLIEKQMKRLGMSPEREHVSRRQHRNTKARRKLSRDAGDYDEQRSQLYMKSGGKYIPIEPVASGSNVQIIVPEIVVKLPETRTREVAISSSPVSSNKVLEKSPLGTQDQVIQTDEGCGTMTSGETSSVVEKMSAQFERTQFLLDRMCLNSGKFESAPNGNFLSLLHKRKPDGGEGFSKSLRSVEEKITTSKRSHNAKGNNDASIGEAVKSTTVLP